MPKSSNAPAHSSEDDISTKKNLIINWVTNKANSKGGDGQASDAEFPGVAKGLFGTAGPDDGAPAASADASTGGGIGLVGVPDFVPDNGGGDFI